MRKYSKAVTEIKGRILERPCFFLYLSTNKDKRWLKIEYHVVQPNKIMTLVLVCFFFSGLTGLIYEILWTRMIVKIIGGAPFAVSIILTVFMGGLGLGSYLAGQSCLTENLEIWFSSFTQKLSTY